MKTKLSAYLRSHMWENMKPLLYIVVFSLALTLVLAFTGQIYEGYEYNKYTDSYIETTVYDSTVWIPAMVLVIAAYFVPVMEFSFFKKRRNLDCAYALPISRREMAIAHYLTGLMTVIVPYTLSYILNALLMLRAPEEYVFAPMLGHYFLCLALGVCIYSVFVFVFNQANSVGDGIWFIILWTFAIMLVCITADFIFDFFPLYNSIYGSAYLGIPWAPLSDITSVYDNLIEAGNFQLTDFWGDAEKVFRLAFWLLAGVASAIGFFLTFGRRRMEKTEEISDSFFGYRVLIPVYAVGGMISGRGFVALWVIVEILTLLGYTIYRRGFHYKKSDLIILALLFLFLFI